MAEYQELHESLRQKLRTTVGKAFKDALEPHRNAVNTWNWSVLAAEDSKLQALQERLEAAIFADPVDRLLCPRHSSGK